MLHALNNKKARLDRVIKGVAKQPREDLITSTVFGALDFMDVRSRAAALKALLQLELSSTARMILWPRFYREGQRQRVEPDVVICDGQDCHIIEVKWGAYLGAGQLERQIGAVSNWVYRSEEHRQLIGRAPRRVKTLTVLGFEKHHAVQVAACAEHDTQVLSRTWQAVAKDMLALKQQPDGPLTAWSQQVHQFLTNTPKARTMQGWPALDSPGTGCLKFNSISFRDLIPVPQSTWRFPASKYILN
ncbi:hypothetical protein [Paracoccus sp. 228]|uniref:hypothetical protein n=1 Tax=Paracoccus sp. 228 TaxID=1192054 RepID=UPI000B13104C|nr:hypothetical protein [Paracoccus sp. 228]